MLSYALHHRCPTIGGKSEFSCLLHRLYQAGGTQHPRWGREETSTYWSNCRKHGGRPNKEGARWAWGSRDLGELQVPLHPSTFLAAKVIPWEMP